MYNPDFPSNDSPENCIASLAPEYPESNSECSNW